MKAKKLVWEKSLARNCYVTNLIYLSFFDLLFEIYPIKNGVFELFLVIDILDKRLITLKDTLEEVKAHAEFIADIIAQQICGDNNAS